MYFTGAKFVSNDLIKMGDMAIFVLCKIIYSFMYANMLILTAVFLKPVAVFVWPCIFTVSKIC